MGFVVLALAVWRVSSLIVYEEGPWDVLCKVRHLLGVRYDALSKPYGLNVVGKALCCMWCTSVWVGIAFVLVFLAFPSPSLMVSFPLGLSALAILFNKAVGNE